jgi:membrane-bound inhibitor of C-type lysozyme
LFLDIHFLSLSTLLVASVAACSAEESITQDHRKRYICEGGQVLDTVRNRDVMIVRTGELIVNNLRAKSGSVGERYTDDEATLITDGNEAVFVSTNGIALRNCRLNSHLRDEGP